MIREARLNDYEEIQNICEHDLGYKCDRELVKVRLANLDNDRECVFVADKDNKVIGFIHVEKYDILYAASMVNVLGLAVSDEFRKQGIGKKLLSKAEEWAKCKGIAMMRLNSGITRKDAHEFYRNMGFDNEKTQLRFIKSL